MSFNTKLQLGLEYEKYVQKIIKNKYINCWLWCEVPKHILFDLKIINNNQENCDDIGCDIVCQNNDLTFLFVQCKNYSTTGNDNTISIHDLSGFYNFIAETGFNGSVYYSGKLSSQIICRKKRINYINLPYITNNQILDFLPRDYQIEAYNYIKNNNKNILSMPCGTGKTFVSFLLSLEYNNIIILTPLISTTEQIHSHYKNYYSKYDNINFILVNCKAERNISNITDKLVQNQKDKNIISSTYDSCDVINKLLLNLENPLIIIDEFHNLSNNMLTNHKSEMNKLILNNKDILFMSATPLKTNIQNILPNNIFELSWKDAIKNKYICDYNFYYPDNDKIITKINNMKIDKTIIDKTILINKAYFLLDVLKLTKVIKCIVYLKTIQEMNAFIKIIQTINLYFELNIKIYEINYKSNVNLRNNNLIKFKNDNSCINILCNVHILDEGIDIPECDSIYLTHPNNNIISIIQRISRANRLDKNNINKIAKIFVWSKNEIKLESIIKNISKFIYCKYGKENNECINYKKNFIIENSNKINNDKLKNFIKKYSKLPYSLLDNFIDDFFIIYDFNECNNDNFSINIDVIAKWFKMTTGHIKDTLLYSYKEKIDYKIIKGKSNGLKGKPKDTILLTPKCFKLMAMQSKTKKAIQVREYYYELEQVIDQYKEYIIKGLEEKIKKLENNQKPKINPSKGVIYILETSDGLGHYKVGKTKNLKQRLKQYNGDKKDDIIPLYVYETDNIDEIERCVKSYAKQYQYRKYKEVYKADINMLKDLINDCGEFNEKTNLKIKWKSYKQNGGNHYIAIFRD
jgi:superfamily II DNA or RNA helicase